MRKSIAFLPALILLAACSQAVEEPVASSEDPLRPFCGPVHFTGTGTSPNQAKALANAETDARKTCEATPSYCWVDCANAPIAKKECGIVDHLHTYDPEWTCEVTIAASSNY